MFPTKVTERFVEIVFGVKFFSLFAHWAVSVRQSFHHLVLFRLYHFCRFLQTDILDFRRLKIEYLSIKDLHDQESTVQYRKLFVRNSS